MSNQSKGYMLGLIAVLSWSTVASVFKLSLDHVDFLQLLFFSNLVSATILGTILICRGKTRVVFSFRGRQYARSALLGFLNPFLYYLILFKAYDLLPAQEAQPLNYTWALTLPLLSIPLLRQRITSRDIIALIMGYCGVIVISTRGDVIGFRLSDPLGVGLAVGSAFVWALYWIYNTKDDRDPIVCLFLNFSFALPMTFLACFFFSAITVPDIFGLIGSVYVGAFEMSVTFVLWLSALRLSENTAKVSVLIFISPVFSLVLIHFLVGEDILPSTIIGLILIVIGLVIQKIGSRSQSPTDSLVVAPSTDQPKAERPIDQR